jgi:hypothetical protein
MRMQSAQTVIAAVAGITFILGGCVVGHPESDAKRATGSSPIATATVPPDHPGGTAITSVPSSVALLACPSRPTASITSQSVTAPTAQDVLNGTSWFTQASGPYVNPGSAPVSIEVELIVSYVSPSGVNESERIVGAPASLAAPTFGMSESHTTEEWQADGGVLQTEPAVAPLITGVQVGWDYLDPGLYHCNHDLPGELPLPENG